jgi:hypothetical protein
MGTILEFHGIKIRVIPGDHLPRHIHCTRGDAQIRYDLDAGDWMDDETRFSRSDLATIEAQIIRNLE